MSETRTVVTSETLMAHITGQAPAAPEAKTPEPTGEEQKTGAEATGQEGEQKGKKKPLIEELVRTRHERNEAKTENEQLRAELEQLRQRIDASQTVAPVKDPDPKPVRTQFVSDDDYMEALADWTADRKLAERQQEDQQARIQAAQQQMGENWERRLEVAKVTLTDYDDVVGKSDIDLPNPIYMAIVEADLGPEISYYLAKNPDEVRLLKGMTLTAAVRMIGKLEDRLEREKETPKTEEKKEAKPVVQPEKSKAPPPIEPLKDATGSVEKPTSQMTFAEYKAHRAAQAAARKR
jgi:regulator of replication initiation timing